MSLYNIIDLFAAKENVKLVHEEPEEFISIQDQSSDSSPKKKIGDIDSATIKSGKREIKCVIVRTRSDKIETETV